jgi:hypothetical protein
MALRDDLLIKFGPKLLEAFTLMLLDEINILRAQLSLSPRTAQQLLTQLSNHVTTIPDYDWMDEEP